MSRFFDAHTHAHFAAYQEDWPEVIERALAGGVWFNTVGTQRDTSRRAVELTRKFDQGVYATVGLHPVHTNESFHDAEEIGAAEGSAGFTSREESFDEIYYEELARDPKVVAIGECGLDYYHLDSAPVKLASAVHGASKSPEESAKVKENQKNAFLGQIRLAKKVGKPLMIHCRDDRKSGTGPAYNDLLEILKQEAPFPRSFIAHSFVRDLALAKKLLDLGSCFTFNGILTFTHDYDEVVRYLPADRILSETDAPYLTPVPHRGERNEPAYVVEVVKKIAEIRGISVDAAAELTFQNACRVFGINT